MNGSKLAAGCVLVATGLTVMVGSIAGTLGPALAALFDPSILTPTTESTTGGIPLLPVGQAPPDEGIPVDGEPTSGSNPPDVEGGDEGGGEPELPTAPEPAPPLELLP